MLRLLHITLDAVCFAGWRGLLSGEFVDGGLCVSFAGFEEGGWEVGFVGGVGVVLGFEAEGGEAVEGVAGTVVVTVEVVGGVELEGWLGGEEGECASGAWVVGFGCWA